MITASWKIQIDPIKNLEGIKASVRNKALRKALMAASKPILDAAKSTAPQDTGALKYGLGRLVKVRGNTAFAKIGPKSKYQKQKKSVTKRPARYAHIVQKGGKFHHPQPYLESGWNPGKVQDTIRQVVWESIKASL